MFGFGSPKGEQSILWTDSDNVVWRITTYKDKRPSRAVKANDPTFVQERVRVPRKVRLLNSLVLIPTIGLGIYLTVEFVLNYL